VALPLSCSWFGISNTLSVFFSSTRDAQAAKQFFLKTLAASHTSEPRVINVDKNAAYPKAFAELKAEGRLPESCELTSASNISIIWLNKITARIKRLTKPEMGFSSVETAWRTLQGDEIMNGMRKGQLQGREKGDVVGEATFIARLFGVAA
jgi:transposase, IS6 family